MNAVAEKETQTAPAQTEAANIGPTYVAPRVQVTETEGGYVIEAEMPGVNKEGLTVNLEGNVLTLEGRRYSKPVSGSLIYRESRPAVYRRVFELDTDVNAEKISAHISQGVLTLQLPKAAKVKPRQIEIS